MLNNGVIWVKEAGVLAVGLLISLSVVACDNTTESGPPDIVDESQLDFVPRKTTAPPLATLDTSFWAVKGQDRELEIRYQGQGGPGTGERFLEFLVEEQTLLRRPDGSQFAMGDSIEITVSIDPQLFIVTFGPAGLQFNPNEPAKLELEYDEAEDEYLAIEGAIDFWKQENPGDDWERQISVRTEELDEIEVLLISFTRYGLAVGR